MSCIVILALSELEWTVADIRIYPSSLLLPLVFVIGKLRKAAWAEVMTAAMLGGLLSWKVADLWPLFAGLPILCAILLLVPIKLLCKTETDRCLGCGLGALVYELCFCLREYLLFSFCVVRLGSRDAFSLAATALCLIVLLNHLRIGVLPNLKRLFSIRI